jgi:hypothetical protein
MSRCVLNFDWYCTYYLNYLVPMHIDSVLELPVYSQKMFNLLFLFIEFIPCVTCYLNEYNL